MATAATAATAAAEAPAPKGKKKLIIIISAVVLVVVLAGAAAALLLMKKGADEHDDEDAQAPQATQTASRGSRAAPIFVPLDAFTVNLADRDAERYAQIGITLEISDAKIGDEIKLYMPAIRNNILLVIAERTAGDLMGREGKAQLADEVIRETSRALGFEVEDEPPADAGNTRKRRQQPPALPIRAVHFSNFIIQ